MVRNISNEFSVQAKREGKTLYSFTNDWLDAASKISAEGGSAKEVLGHWRFCAVLRQVDITTLPVDFDEEMILKMYATGKENLFKMFSDLGSGLVTLTKMAAPENRAAGIARKRLRGRHPH